MSDGCEYCGKGLSFMGADEWALGKQYDSEYYIPIEAGVVVLVPCPLQFGYHMVTPDGGLFTTGKYDQPVVERADMAVGRGEPRKDSQDVDHQTLTLLPPREEKP